MTSTLAAAPGGLRFVAGITELLDSDTGLASLRSAADAAVGRLDEFASWLEALCTNDIAVRDITDRSYWHPNGFAKIVLHSSAEPHCRLRFHVWPAGMGRLGESNPHSHRWEFASTVVVGRGLHMVEYAETEFGGVPYDRYRYGANPADKAELMSEGAVRLRRRNALHAERGEIYSCDTDVIHTVAPIGSGLTATLVVQGPQRTPSTVVYRAPGLGADQPNGVLTESDFRQLAADVVAAYRRETA